MREICYRSEYAFDVRGPLTLMKFEKELGQSWEEGFEWQEHECNQV
jgi:hypothetical protein